MKHFICNKKRRARRGLIRKTIILTIGLIALVYALEVFIPYALDQWDKETAWNNGRACQIYDECNGG